MERLVRQRQMTRGTSGRIVQLLRQGPRSIDELAAAVGVTRTAVRAQLATLQRDGTVEQRDMQRGASKPARTYGVTADAELQLSRAYVPILTQLLHLLAERMPRSEFDAVMREVGRGLMSGRGIPCGSLADRVQAAGSLLNDLGGMAEISDEGNSFVIRGHGCPLAAATARYPEACNALESLLSEFVGRPVVSCCDRYRRQRCCFEIAHTDPVAGTAV